MRFHHLCAASLLTCVAVAGCRSGDRATLPTTPSSSTALPGSTDAADAPNAPAVRESAAANQTAYSDPLTGVHFSYPTAWRPLQTGGVMHGPSFGETAGAPRMSEAFLPAQTAYAKTNLIGLSFSYTAKHGLSAADCQQLVPRDESGPTAAQTEIIHGITYQRADSEDDDLCHKVRLTVDSTLQHGECLVFERDLQAQCPGVQGGRRALTAAERRTLQDQLAAVMDSVTLGTPR